MSYDDDILPHESSKSIMTNEDSLRFLIMIITILMLIIGLPSLFSNVYENPLPGIIMLGFIAIILSIFYLGNQIQKLQRSK